MVAVATRCVRHHRTSVCAVPVFRPTAKAVYQSAPRYGTAICSWGVGSCADGSLHSIFSGAVWCAAFLYRSGNSRCHHAYGGHGASTPVCHPAKNCPASSMGDSQLCNCVSVHWCAICFGNHGLGNSWSRNRAGNHLVLPRAVSSICRCCDPLERTPFCLDDTNQVASSIKRGAEAELARKTHPCNLVRSIRKDSLALAGPNVTGNPMNSRIALQRSAIRLTYLQSTSVQTVFSSPIL